MKKTTNYILKIIGNNKQIILALGFFVVSANMFAYYFISQERFIYFWDFATYFNKFVYLGEHLLSEPKEAIEAIFWGIRENKYNHFPVLVFIPVSLILGTTRMVYILSILNIYALPALLVLIVLVTKLAEKWKKPSSMIPWIVVGLVLLSPDLWNPILKGFLAVGGLIVTNLILLLYLRETFSKQKLRNIVFTAVLIALVVIFRRWYSFWCVAFYAVLGLEIILTSILNKPFKKEILITNLLKITMMGAISGIIYFIVAPTYVMEILSTNYVDLNSPDRQSANLGQAFLVVLKSFGLLYFTMFTLGLINALTNKETRRFTLFVLCQSVIIFIMFARTQDFDSHHRYLFLPQVILFSSLFLNNVLNTKTKFKFVTLGIVLALLMTNFIVAFGPQKKLVKKSYPTLFTDIRHQPFVRNDLNEIERMLQTLDTLIKNPDERIYVLSSSDLLNSHILTSARIHFQKYENVSTKVLGTHDLDKRSGFPMPLLHADYVIVPNSVQVQMDPKDQRVLIEPTILFHKNEGIAQSFQRMPYEFILDTNVKVHIYKKVKPINDSDVYALSETLRQYYPDRPYIYEVKEL